MGFVIFFLIVIFVMVVMLTSDSSENSRTPDISNRMNETHGNFNGDTRIMKGRKCHFTANDVDWITDPAYFWMPGNIFYHDYHDDTPDYYNDPAYSNMPGNIFYDDWHDHHHDTFNHSSDDNTFTNDHSFSSSTSFSNDDWNKNGWDN